MQGEVDLKAGTLHVWKDWKDEEAVQCIWVGVANLMSFR